uniref:Putative secreted peptide n=1 Tax=Anopheles braziliensis TaxID=58242 RepID=A0A2M3ZQB9_9DIPT
MQGAHWGAIGLPLVCARSVMIWMSPASLAFTPASSKRTTRPPKVATMGRRRRIRARCAGKVAPTMPTPATNRRWTRVDEEVVAVVTVVAPMV